MKPAYLILDLETTGTDPNSDLILEVGAILVDENLTRISSFSTVVRHDDDHSEYSEFVQEMHEGNGLWVAARECEVSIKDARTALLAWLVAHEAQGVQLAGNSPHAVDRPFLAADMPEVLAMLSHRQVDISGIARELKLAGLPVEEVKADTHRALLDATDELVGWRKMRRVLAEMAHPIAVVTPRVLPAPSKTLAAYYGIELSGTVEP